MKRVLSVALLGFAAGLWAAPAAAQTYPTRPVQVIIPFDAGGNTDLMARALQEEMGRALGQPIVPLNKPGAAATLGTGELARAKPDGYTIGMVPIGPIAIQPNIRKLPYDVQSFDYICQTFDVPIFLMVPKSSQFKTARDVVSFAKAQPNAFLYGSSGPGTMPHIATAAFLRAAGVTGTHVPFRGSGEMAQALLGGTIMAFSDAPALAAANDLHVLAVYSEKREPTHPDTPSMKELGYDFTGSIWGGLIAPKGLPQPVLAALERACEKAATSEGYKQTAGRLKSVPTYKSGKEFRAFAESQSKALGEVVVAAGLQAK